MKRFFTVSLASLILISSICLSSCRDNNQGDTKNPESNESSSMVIENPGGDIDEIRTGLKTSDVENVTEIHEWLDKCRGDDRNDFGCYILKYTEKVDDKTFCYFLLYRTNIEKSAEVDVKLDKDEASYVLTVNYTTRKDESSYDLTYIKLVLNDNKKVFIEPKIDGKDPESGYISSVAGSSIALN